MRQLRPLTNGNGPFVTFPASGTLQGRIPCGAGHSIGESRFMANPRENEDRVTRTADIGVDAQNHGVLRLGRPKADVVAELVAAHREKDPQLRAYWNPNGPPDEIQLVEVTPEVADTDEVLAFRFGATPDFEY
ncbi:MAG: hypothetical protein ACI9OJ_003045, partial [Myxococcota bacterium]